MSYMCWDTSSFFVKSCRNIFFSVFKNVTELCYRHACATCFICRTLLSRKKVMAVMRLASSYAPTINCHGSLGTCPSGVKVAKWVARAALLAMHSYMLFMASMRTVEEANTLFLSLVAFDFYGIFSLRKPFLNELSPSVSCI